MKHTRLTRQERKEIAESAAIMYLRYGREIRELDPNAKHSPFEGHYAEEMIYAKAEQIIGSDRTDNLSLATVNSLVADGRNILAGWEKCEKILGRR